MLNYTFASLNLGLVNKLHIINLISLIKQKSLTTIELEIKNLLEQCSGFCKVFFFLASFYRQKFVDIGLLLLLFSVLCLECVVTSILRVCGVRLSILSVVFFSLFFLVVRFSSFIVKFFYALSVLHMWELRRGKYFILFN